jgi:3-isopropylmalate/(R)-2-methylmalate dehydratase small subunit
MSTAIEPFSTLTAIAAPLPWVDVNTDDIFPAAGLKKSGGGTAVMTDRNAMGANAFREYRFRPDGSANPDFVLNQPPYDRSRILVAGRNFGCGSSREMAVWSLSGIGLRCIIAPSFADIFYSNCVTNGLLPVILTDDEVKTVTTLITDQPGTELAIDLDAQTVGCPDGRTFTFTIGSYHRHLLRHGLDEIAATLQRTDVIEDYESKYFEERPWVIPTIR